jgi:hypothetical protein
MNQALLKRVKEKVSSEALKTPVVTEALPDCSVAISIVLNPPSATQGGAWVFQITTNPPDIVMADESYNAEQIALYLKDELDRALSDELPSSEWDEIFECKMTLALNGRVIPFLTDL